MQLNTFEYLIIHTNLKSGYPVYLNSCFIIEVNNNRLFMYGNMKRNSLSGKEKQRLLAIEKPHSRVFAQIVLTFNFVQKSFVITF